MTNQENNEEVDSKSFDVLFLDNVALFVTTDDFVPKIVDTLKISKEYFGSGDKNLLDNIDSNILNNAKKRFKY